MAPAGDGPGLGAGCGAGYGSGGNGPGCGIGRGSGRGSGRGTIRGATRLFTCSAYSGAVAAPSTAVIAVRIFSLFATALLRPRLTAIVPLALSTTVEFRSRTS